MTVSPALGVRKSGWGPRVAPVPGASTFHRGFDIAAPTGTRVVSPELGVVTVATKNSVRGLYVVIDHGWYSTLHQHLSKIFVKVGQKVDEGQAIGEVGETGVASGPHLHTEVHSGSTPIDPDPWYRERGVVLGTPSVRVAGVRVTAPPVFEENDMRHLWQYTSADPDLFVITDDLTMTYRIIPSGSLQEGAIKNDLAAGVRRCDVISDPAWGDTFGNGQYRRIDKPEPMAGAVDVAALAAAVAKAVSTDVDEEAVAAAVLAELKDQFNK